MRALSAIPPQEGTPRVGTCRRAPTQRPDATVQTSNKAGTRIPTPDRRADPPSSVPGGSPCPGPSRPILSGTNQAPLSLEASTLACWRYRT